MTEDFNECPKCHNTAVELRQALGPQALTVTAKYCDCPTAQLYLAGIRCRFAALKSRLTLLQPHFLELMAHLAAQKPETPEGEGK